MLKATVTPTQSEIAIRIPKEYINHEVEILVLPLFEMQAPQKAETMNRIKLWQNSLKMPPMSKLKRPKISMP